MVGFVAAGCGDGGGGNTTPACAVGEFCECTTSEDCPSGEVCGPSLVCVAGEVDAADGQDGPDATDATDATDVPDSDPVEDVTDVVDTDTVNDATDGEGSGDDAVTDAGDGSGSDAEDADAATPDTEVDTDVAPDGDTGVEIQPIVDPWIAFVSQALFDLTLPDSSPRPANEVLSDQIMITRRGEPFAIHVPTGDLRVSSPVWSPSGLELAYLSGRSNQRSLKIVNLETAAVRTVRDTLPVNPASIAWTWDGSALIVVDFPEGAANPDVGLELYRVEISDGTLTQLTDTDGVSENFPRCLPDGFIYFVSSDNGQNSIARMDAEGGEIEVLARNVGIGGAIGVTPDGAFAFGTVVDGGDSSVVRVDLESGEITELPGNNRGALDVAADGSLMIGFTTISEDTALVPLDPFDAEITGARFSTQPDPAAHPDIDIVARPVLLTPAIAPISSSAVDLAEEFGGGGT